MESSTLYDGAHSLTFRTLDGKTIRNTWQHWYLIPSSRPVVAAPGVATNYVEIPGRGDPIDLTEYLTGQPVYGSRSGSWEFIVDNDHEYWESIRSKMTNFLHGKVLQVILEDVPTRYWEGRFSVATWQPEADYSKITINYALDPYSYSVYETDEDWLWDPFNFDTDYTDNTDRKERL